MSIDLEWNKLDSSLASTVVDLLNRQLRNIERPSFIGPVEVTSLDFGSNAPDVELVDLRDIYRDFLEDDEEDVDRGPVRVSDGTDDDEGFEWVSRRTAGRGAAYQHLPPHMRYGRYGSASMFAPPPTAHSPMEPWNPSTSMPGLDYGHSPYSALPEGTPPHRSPSPATPFSALPLRGSHESLLPKAPLAPSSHAAHADLSPPYTHSAEPAVSFPHPSSPSQPSPSQSQQQQQQPPSNPPHPNLQLHLHVNWHSNLRITLTTSLLINYPSPMFMSLPIKLSVTGLVFNGELAVAYEGERRRVHLCILDDLDPYGPAGDRPKREPEPNSGGTPPELDDDSPSSAIPGGRPSKPLPVGQRLLPSIYIESEIGQTDKHVLKNVTRVERFIQDVIRKTVEEELVFPNFHTLLMGDPQ